MLKAHIGVLVLLLILFKHSLTSSWTIALVFLRLNLSLNLLLSLLKAHDLSVLLFYVSHDLPLHL